MNLSSDPCKEWRERQIQRKIKKEGKEVFKQTKTGNAENKNNLKKNSKKRG